MQFKEFLRSLPSSKTAKGLFLLATRTDDAAMLYSVMVYLARDVGTDAMTSFLLEEIDPMLTPEERVWMWETIDSQRRS